jgi:hypothetical protein
MKRAIGYVVLAVPVAGVALATVVKFGWVNCLISFGVTAAIIAWIALVVWLITR